MPKILLFLVALVVLAGPHRLPHVRRMKVGEERSSRREDVNWSRSGMLVRVCVVLGGRGRDGTMMWWVRGGRGIE